MITCRRAAELISGEQDADLPLLQGVVLGLHSFLCRSCRRYRAQLGVVETAAMELFAGCQMGHDDVALSPESKLHLNAMINMLLDEED